MKVAQLLIFWGTFSYIVTHGVGLISIVCISLVPLGIGILRLFSTPEYTDWKKSKIKG